jgi:putative ABC transport system substrate-binding protein
MAINFKRRRFIAAVGSAAAWPLVARAQQPAMPVIGWLSSGTRETDDAFRLPSFRLGLSEKGYTEGRNVAIEYRRADDQVERLTALAADLAGRRVSLIMAAGRPDAALAAKSVTINSDCVQQRGRSRAARSGCEPQSARREHNGSNYRQRRT